MRHVIANDISDDILIGCNFGDITGFIDGKIITLREAAHANSINCIKITKLSKDVKRIYLNKIYFISNSFTL